MTLARSLAALAKQHDRRILILDIERLPGLAPVWEQRTKFIPARTWKQAPETICFAAKWHDEAKVMFHAVWDDADEMVQRAWELYDSADIVVGYNQVNFDDKHMRGLWVRAGLVPPTPWKSVDLYRSTAQFGFASRSLAYTCQQLGIAGKSGHYDPDLAWRAVVDDDLRAQRSMRRYNVGDVRATERLYERLLPWVRHPHVRNARIDELTCPRCGSSDLRPNGEYLAVVRLYAQYRCGVCGGNAKASHIKRVAATHGI